MYSDDIIMTSLVRELPLPQVLGDIEIAQTLKKNQEEASQQQEEVRNTISDIVFLMSL